MSTVLSSDAVKNCLRCNKEFGLLTRRHSCDVCSSVVCAACMSRDRKCRMCFFELPRVAMVRTEEESRSAITHLEDNQRQVLDVRCFATSATFRALSPHAFKQRLASALRSLVSVVMTPTGSTSVAAAAVVVVMPERSAEQAAVAADEVASVSQEASPFAPLTIPADPAAPLFADPAQHRGTSTFKNIAEWLFALPDLEAAAVPDVEARAPFGAAHDAAAMADHWQSQIAFWLEIIADELENPGPSYIATISQRLRGKPTTSDPIAAAKAVQQRLHAAVDALHTLGVDPTVAADELASVLLYTSNIDPQGTPSNRSMFAVANLLLRTCRAAGDKPDSDAQKLLAVYAPFIVRTDTFLARMPKQRRTLFRGVGFDFALQHYAAGSTVSWGQFNSTTTDVEVAQSFSAGKTLFVLHAGSTAQVDFASVFPEEAETLLPSSSVFTSLGVTSPGLMRLLGQHGNLVQLRELGDDPTAQQVVTGMEEAKHALATLSDTFTESYVEARISIVPPPLPDDVECLMLFQQLLPRFLECSGEFVDQHKHLALLAAGGTGKTSTLLALHTHISRNDHVKQFQQQQSKSVISIFVALPKLPGDIQDGKCIDAQVLAELGARDFQAAATIAAEATIVVLLDSLDECVIHGDPKSWRALLDIAPFCRDHCRVIVSSRPEFAERLSSSAAHFVFGSTTVEMHVLPLTAAAHDTFISKFVAGRNKEFEMHAKIHKNSNFSLFQVAEPAVRSALAKLQLSDDDQRLPVVLTMALEVALHDVRHPKSSSTSDSYCPPLGTRSHVMYRFMESRRTVILPNATEHTIDAAAFNTLCDALTDVALAMLDRGDWNVTLGTVRKQLLTTVPAANNSESDNDRALRVLGWHVPCRVESVHDNSSLFGFWHKSLGEYLCARALFLDPTATITDKLTTAFSLREPNVCWFFNDLCLGDLPQRRKVTSGPLYDIVIGRNSASSPAAISNAFALICCSDDGLAGRHFCGVGVSDCNLLGADLSGVNLSKATIRNSNLRNVCFDNCDITDLLLKGNEYNLRLPPLTENVSAVHAVAISPDSRLVASTSDAAVRIWNVEKGGCKSLRTGHTGNVTAVCFSDCSRWVVTGGHDNAVRIHAVGGEAGPVLDGHTDKVECVCICHDEENCVVASGGFDQTVRLWPVVFPTDGTPARQDPARVLPFERVLRGHSSSITALSSASTSSKLVSSDANFEVRIWSARLGTQLVRLDHSIRTPILALAFSPSGKEVMVGGADNTCATCDAQRGNQLKLVRGPARAGSSLAFGADLNICICGSGSDIILWDTNSGKEIKSLRGHLARVSAVCLSVDGKWAISGSDDRGVRVWHATEDSKLRRNETSRGESFQNVRGSLKRGGFFSRGDGSDVVAVELAEKRS